eukprot:tig00021374_g21083.t1
MRSEAPEARRGERPAAMSGGTLLQPPLDRGKRRPSSASLHSSDSGTPVQEPSGLARLASEIRQAEVLEEGEYALRRTWSSIRFADAAVEEAYWESLRDAMFLRYVFLSVMWCLGFAGLVFLWPVFVPNGFSYRLALASNGLMCVLTGASAGFLYCMRGSHALRHSWQVVSAGVLCIAACWMDLIALRGYEYSGLCS